MLVLAPPKRNRLNAKPTQDRAQRLAVESLVRDQLLGLGFWTTWFATAAGMSMTSGSSVVTSCWLADTNYDRR